MSRSKVKKIHREQAILLCLIASSNDGYESQDFYYGIARDLGWNDGKFWRDNPAIQLAFDAYQEARRQHALPGEWNALRDYWRQCEALAATLLQEGWSPS